jgi:hypothetical protein
MIGWSSTSSTTPRQGAVGRGTGRRGGGWGVSTATTRGTLAVGRGACCPTPAQGLVPLQRRFYGVTGGAGGIFARQSGGTSQDRLPPVVGMGFAQSLPKNLIQTRTGGEPPASSRPGPRLIPCPIARGLGPPKPNRGADSCHNRVRGRDCSCRHARTEVWSTPALRTILRFL